MRMSDWSSDVCSSDLETVAHLQEHFGGLDPKLGTVLRLRHGEGANRVDLPLDGGNDTVRASTLWDEEPDGRLNVRPGDSFIMLERKSVVSGKSVSVRVDLGCTRVIHKKKK